MKVLILIVLLVLLTGFQINIEPNWTIPPVTTLVSGDDVPRHLPNEQRTPASGGQLVMDAALVEAE
jgi:hypothetical protein